MVLDSNNVSIGSHIFKVNGSIPYSVHDFSSVEATFTGFYHEIPPLKILFIVSQAQGISFRTIISGFLNKYRNNNVLLKELNLYFVDE